MRTSLLLLLCAGCLPKHPYYDSFSLELPSEPLEPAVQIAYLEASMRRGEIASLFEDGTETPPRALSPAARTAVSWASGRYYRHAEVDILVPEGDAFRPVSVIQDGRGNLRIEVGPTWTPPTTNEDVAALKAEIIEDYGLHSIVDGSAEWTVDELLHVREALRRFPEALLPAISDVQLGREHQSPRAPRSELALYQPNLVPRRIDVFDIGFSDYPNAFTGPPDDPVSPAVVTVVHELGHVVADWPWIEAWSKVESGQIPNTSHLRGRGPVVTDYRELGWRPAPTLYGNRSAHESFAEAFALWVLDRPALDRWNPAVGPWMDQGGLTGWRQSH